MPTTRRQLNSFQDELGLASLVHGPSSIDRACLIARDGILPGNDVQQLGRGRVWDGTQQSRGAYVYLGTAEYLAQCVDNVSQIFEVAIDDLTPARLACDEDHVCIYTTGDRSDGPQLQLSELLPDAFHTTRMPENSLRENEQISWRRGGPLPQPPPSSKSGPSQATWADRVDVAPVLARSEFVRASLTLGSVAHHGPIKASLLRPHMAWWRNKLERGRLDGSWGRLHVIASGRAALQVESLRSLAAVIALMDLTTDEREQLTELLVGPAERTHRFDREQNDLLPGVLRGQLTHIAGSRDAALEATREIEQAVIDAEIANAERRQREREASLAYRRTQREIRRANRLHAANLTPEQRAMVS